MGRAAAVLSLVRPHNAVIAAAGAFVGAVGTLGLELHWDGVALAALATMFGVAGGNALNDARDLNVDRRAHPNRPLPMGTLSVRSANLVASTCFLLALGVAALTNLLVFLLSIQLLAVLFAYELALKNRGLIGHFLVSYNVGVLFPLGAIAGGVAPLTYRLEPLGSIVHEPRFALALTMGVLALGLNWAREVFKAAQDVGGDVVERRTYAVVHGPERARVVAVVLILVVVLLSLAPYALGIFDAAYVALVAPLLAFLLYVLFVRDPGRAQRLLKVGMLAGFAPFLAVGLL